jgi:hypothetical protein
MINTSIIQNLKYRVLNIVKNIDEISHWENISRLGKKKMINTISIWTIIVPIVVKWIIIAENNISFEIFKAKFQLDIQIGLNFYLFYFSSVCFAFGSILYGIMCPSIIKNYSSFAEYIDKENSYEKLKKLMIELYSKKYSPLENAAVISIYLERYCEYPNRDRLLDYPGWKQKIEASLLKSGMLPEAFSYVKNEGNKGYSLVRIVCMSLYLFGLVILMYVFIDNVYIVSHKFYLEIVK